LAKGPPTVGKAISWTVLICLPKRINYT